MKQKAEASPVRFFAQLLKRSQEITHKSSKVDSSQTKKSSSAVLKIEAKKNRPLSGVQDNQSHSLVLKKNHQRQNSKILEAKENQSQISATALQLLQKLRAERPESRQSQATSSKQILQHHQELIQKQYQKLLEMQQRPQQRPKLVKGGRSISNPDISSIKIVITKVEVKTLAGIAYNGQTKINQDSFRIIPKFNGKESDWLLQVSDGHGSNGHHVSGFIKEILPGLIEKGIQKCPLYDRDKFVNNLLRQSFLQSNHELLQSGIDVHYSGATTCTILALENMLYCANIGDSRAILARVDHKLSVIELSKDHKPDCFLEQARIIQRGGRVQAYSDEDGNPVGPARVWKQDEDVPGLAMSRSFGDYVASCVGVIQEPEIIKHSLLPSDKFIVIASDGIWEFLSNEWVAETVLEFHRKGDAQGACTTLVQAAKEAWQREDEVIDDITVIVAFINP